VTAKLPDWKSLRHCISTWLSTPDYVLLYELAKSENVKVSVYIRAIVVDVIAEERERRGSAKTNGSTPIEIQEQIGLR
jgi:hypothetical protein